MKFLGINIFIMIIISSNFIFNFTNFCIVVSFFDWIIKSGISSSTTVRAVVVAKSVISGILTSIFFILALYTSF